VAVVPDEQSPSRTSRGLDESAHGTKLVR
jgi:hypothetical protein